MAPACAQHFVGASRGLPLCVAHLQSVESKVFSFRLICGCTSKSIWERWVFPSFSARSIRNDLYPQTGLPPTQLHAQYILSS